MLNRGGFANPDVLAVPRRDGSRAAVKDYGGRSAPIRFWVAPLLVRRELALLRRVEGLPGVPRALGRVDALALAMEHVAGQPLRRRTHAAAVPPAFFDALEGILDGLSARGITYLDLRSPSNILVTETGAPMLIDLASATRLPIPAALRRALDRRAISKLRERFESSREPVAGLEAGDLLDLRAGRVRLRYRDRGRDDDPVPALLLPDAGLGSALFSGVLVGAARFGRRAIAVDLTGFGGSGRPRFGVSVGRSARDLEAFLEGMRLARVDVVGVGWGGLVARCLAHRRRGRVRAVITIDAPLQRLTEPFRSRWEDAQQDPQKLHAGVLANVMGGADGPERRELEQALRGVRPERLAAAYRAVRVKAGRSRSDTQLRGVPDPVQPWLLTGSDRDAASETRLGGILRDTRAEPWPWPLDDPARLFRELETLAALG